MIYKITDKENYFYEFVIKEEKKMKKTIIMTLIAMILVFSLTGCGIVRSGENELFKEEQQKNGEIGLKRGTFDGNVYTNESMGVQVTFPEGCTIYSEEELTQELEEDNNGASGYIYDAKVVMADQVTTIQIFLEDTGVTNITKMNADAYARMLLRNLKAGYSQAGVTVSEDSTVKETFGGVDFTIVSIVTEEGVQKYYIHEVDGSMISFIVTSTEDGAAQGFSDMITAFT